MEKEEKETKLQYNQLTGNIGLFYVAYELARRGWNVLITSRNAKGPDMIIYSRNGKLKQSIQVKASGDKDGQVSVGEPDSFTMSDFVIVIHDVYVPTKEHPMYVVATNDLTLRQQAGGAYINKSYWWDENKKKQTSGTYGKHKDKFDALGDPWDGKKTEFLKQGQRLENITITIPAKADAISAWWKNLASR